MEFKKRSESWIRKTYKGVEFALQNEINDHTLNPRDFSGQREKKNVERLAASIDRYGLIQPPVLAKIDGIPGWTIIAGHRRVYAMREILQWKIIPFRPTSWGEIPETMDFEAAAQLLLEDQDEYLPYSSDQKNAAVFRMADQGEEPNSNLSCSWGYRAMIYPFLLEHPDIYKKVISKPGNSGKFPRTKIPYSCVYDSLRYTDFLKAHEDLAVDAIQGYINGDFINVHRMRDWLRNEIAKRKSDDATNKKQLKKAADAA